MICRWCDSNTVVPIHKGGTQCTACRRENCEVKDDPPPEIEDDGFITIYPPLNEDKDANSDSKIN